MEEGKKKWTLFIKSEKGQGMIRNTSRNRAIQNKRERAKPETGAVLEESARRRREKSGKDEERI